MGGALACWILPHTAGACDPAAVEENGPCGTSVIQTEGHSIVRETQMLSVSPALQAGVHSLFLLNLSKVFLDFLLAGLSPVLLESCSYQEAVNSSP